MAKKPTSPQSATPPVPLESAATTAPADMPLNPPGGPATSAVAPAAHAGPPTTKKGALVAKIKQGVPPTLLFYQDYTQAVRGDLRPTPASPAPPAPPAPAGPVLTLFYSAARLPAAAGSSSWQATAYVSYDNGQPPLALALWSPTGQLVTIGSQRGLGEAQMLTAQTPGPIPHDAQDVAVWFCIELGDGQVFWDSNLGQNYHFGFTPNLTVTAAAVAPTPQSPSDSLSVTVDSMNSVSALAINYQVTNTMPDVPQIVTVPLTLLPDLSPAGCYQWSVTGICVPHQAVIYFTVGYTAGGISYVDDNNGQGYLVS